ncbi:putative DNA binding protein [Tripterygium wilfordii]|uniref:Putative DNA binding protein n=1 Tax=Tripterygium wilfordii TaxID=458696 RepID=A0A7J7DR02_TRIWF|nr:uncharacterized protein LOC119997317 [Tripterygium wilfordii]KAF5748785.1 putative DNA binding protein [Tripterygium wilfordii]
MAKKHEMIAQSWGTLEELLLACAVNRHGTSNWDSITMDVKNRTSALPFLTPQHCIEKFNDLRQRFMLRYDAESADITNLVPMVNELRRIRIEELRREVQRHDASILSLELKVKRLEEKRDESLKEEADMEREKKPSLEKFVRKSFTGSDSDDCDRRYFNQSYSSEKNEKELVSAKQKIGGNDTIEAQDEKIKLELNLLEDKFEIGLVQTGSKPGVKWDWSCNVNVGHDGNEDQTMSREKISNSETKRINQGCAEFEEPNELQESVKQGTTKQSSDVQSSASLSRKKKQHTRSSDLGTRGGSSGSGEPDDYDEVSLTTKQGLAIKSELLARLLKIIRSNRLGSMFERPTRSQESERYRNLIRQHMDLQMVQSRLERGDYSDCPLKFFRDLLLLFNNAIIFCRKSSREYGAAQELRGVVLKELTNKIQWRQPVAGETEPEQESASFSKTNKSLTMIACGKCNYFKMITENNDRNGNRRDGEVKNKQKLNGSKIDGSFANTDDMGIRKKQTQDGSVSGFTKLRRSNRNTDLKHELGANELSSHDSLDLKLDKSDRKERHGRLVTSFLKRMNYYLPGEETDDEYDVDHGYEDEDTDYEVEEKEENSKERNARRDRVTRSSRDNGVREKTVKPKRSGGRPLKTQASSTSESLLFGTGRSRRNNGDSEVAGNGGRPRKRTRR